MRGIVQGQSDTPLTEKGITSTLNKAEKIKGLSFDAVYCSDLLRSVETLKLIRSVVSGLPEPVYTRELREIDFGDYTAGLKSDLMPTILKHKAQQDLPYPNGESGGGFTVRVRKFFSKLRDLFEGGQILVVTHYGVMETAARQFTGPLSKEKIHIGPDDVWRIRFANNRSARKEIL